jgi:hypothetical protein
MPAAKTSSPVSKPAPKRTRKAAQEPAVAPSPAPTAPKARPVQPNLTPAQKKALAKQIIALRSAGVAWDTPGTGVCAQVGIRNALVGRAILREAGQGDMIKPLTGLRAPDPDAS